MMADLFCLGLKPAEGDVALSEGARLREGRKVLEVAVIQREETEQLSGWRKGFYVKVRELEFSLGETFSFLLEHRKSTEEGINKVEQLISKPLRISEHVKPKVTQPQIARATKLARKQAREGSLRETRGKACVLIE
jgi:hypothetical protein